MIEIIIKNVLIGIIIFAAFLYGWHLRGKAETRAKDMEIIINRRGNHD